MHPLKCKSYVLVEGRVVALELTAAAEAEAGTGVALSLRERRSDVIRCTTDLPNSRMR